MSEASILFLGRIEYVPEFDGLEFDYEHGLFDKRPAWEEA